MRFNIKLLTAVILGLLLISLIAACEQDQIPPAEEVRETAVSEVEEAAADPTEAPSEEEAAASPTEAPSEEEEASDTTSPDMTVSPQDYSNTRNLRYCELFFFHDDAGTFDVWNTTDNECPDDLWDNMDLDALAQQFGADRVTQNGPQYWMTDSLTLFGSELVDMGGIDFRFGVTIDSSAVGGSSTYVPFSPPKNQTNAYAAGSEVYEIVDDEGNVYVLQARKDDVPVDSLPTLGDQLNLPEGWTYRARTLDEDLAIVLTPDNPNPSVSDEFDQVYVQIPDDSSTAQTETGEDSAAAQMDDGPVDVGPLVGEQSVFVQEEQCMLQLVQDPANNLTNYWPAIGAPEHVNSTHDGVYPCATFTGSFDGENQVFYHLAESNFGDVQFIVFDGPNGAYLMGGGLGVPGSMGQFVSKFNPSTGQEIWRTPLQNANVNGQWIAFGSIGIIEDGTIIASAGPYVWKLDRDTGDILAYNELPVLGSPAQGANYDGFHVAPDENGTILMKTQNIPVGCPTQGNLAMGSCQDDYGPQPPTTVVAADPVTLEAIDAIQLEQQVTARPIVTEYNGTIYMYMAGTTTLQRVIWDPDAGELSVDESWAPEYLLEGQFSGSAPNVLGDWIISNTNVNPSQVPMSVVAIHQGDASRLTRINPWGDDTLPEGVLSFTLGSFGVDPANNMIYAQDFFAGGVYGVLIDQETGEMEVVWERPDWRTSDYFSMIGPANQRVLISQFIGDDFTYQSAATYDYSESVLWVDAATGETIAQSGPSGSTAWGSLPNVGYGGRLYMMGNAGDVFMYQVAPVASEEEAEPSTMEAPDMMVSARDYSDTRNLRYCELFFFHDDAGTFDVYNTTDNECPDDLWDNMDLDALAQQFGADRVTQNGPQYWMTDSLTLFGSELVDMGGIDFRFGVTIDSSAVGGSSTYVPFSPPKNQTNAYAAGSEVYQLVDPDGNVYVLQARKDDIPVESLPTLGSQMTQLPEGWTYQSRVLDEDLAIVLTPDNPNPSVSDEFDQVYVQIQE